MALTETKIINYKLDPILSKILSDVTLFQEEQKIYPEISLEEFILSSLKINDVVSFYQKMDVNVEKLKEDLNEKLDQNFDEYIKPVNFKKALDNNGLGIKMLSKDILNILDLAMKDAFYKDKEHLNKENNDLSEANYNLFLLNLLKQKDGKYPIKEVLVKNGITEEKVKNSPKLVPTEILYTLDVETDGLNKYLDDISNDLEDFSINFIERDKEIDQIVDSLGLHDKQHIILTGDKGIGKRTIVKGLGSKLINFNEEHLLYGANIYDFNFGDYLLELKSKERPTELSYKISEFSESILKERKRVILYIDGSHKCLEYDRLDFTLYLSPLIFNPYVNIIYVLDEKNITPNLYLSDFSTIINIKELNEQQIDKIVSSNVEKYEIYYNLKFNSKSIKSIVELSSKYFIGRKQPEISFEIIDRVGSRCLSKNKKVVHESDVENLICEILNIPKKQLKIKEDNEKINKILNLNNILAKNIIGQEEAINKLSDIILIAQSGIANNGNNKPIASFMFAGTTGVGKTELAKNLSKTLDMSFLRLDMSEYSDRFFSSSLIGAPPGYLGHENGGSLTNFIKENPSSVILLDEIEKAHSSIYNLFLQILDYGMLKNSQGEQIDFRNCILIFTTNAGAKSINKNSIGFFDDLSESNKEDGSISEVNNFFSPEFRNRLDDIIFFKQLNENNLKDILNLKLENLSKVLKDKNIEVDFDHTIKEAILKESVKEKLGARPLERNMNRMLNKDLARLIFTNKLNKNKHNKYNISYDNGLQIVINHKHNKLITEQH